MSRFLQIVRVEIYIYVDNRTCRILYLCRRTCRNLCLCRWADFYKSVCISHVKYRLICRNLLIYINIDFYTYVYINIDFYTYDCLHKYRFGNTDKSVCISHFGMGWLRLLGFLQWWVSFAELRFFYRSLLQKRPRILRSLLIVATLYLRMSRVECESVRLDKYICRHVHMCRSADFHRWICISHGVFWDVCISRMWICTCRLIHL